MEYQRTTMISLQRLSGLLMLMLLHGAPTTQGAMTTLPATAKQKENPESVSISVLSHSGPMVEGTKYQLQCDIQNIAPLRNLVVKWYKGNEPLDNVAYSNVSKTPENVSSTLMIIPGRDDDGAQYKCRAELDLGPEGPQPHPTVTSKPLTITVHYKPEIVCPSQYSTVEEKSTLDRIPCAFHGNPPPNVVWYQEGRQVNASAPLARTDLGQYVITITNDIGSTNSTVHITVEYAPKFNCIDQYEVKENENHNLPVTCTVDANPSSKITWFKGQQEVDIPQSLTRENRGEYTLVTNNTHGEASHKLVIDVLYAPEFLLGNDTVVVSKGSNVSLNCSAEGNPLPEMKWNYTAAEGNTNEITVGRLRTLYISRVTANGTYNCTVTNRLGSITKQIHVLVEEPPQQHPTMFSTAPTTPGTTLPSTARQKVVTSSLVLNPPRVVVRYGDSVSVNCSTSSTDHEGMGWEATFGGTGFEQDVNIVTWTVDNLTDWTIEPKCYTTLIDGEQPSKVLPVILYKTPDRVSISVLSHSGPMVEGTKYQLQCDIQNIAPLRNLVVKWYKGNEPLDNVAYSNVSKTPVDVSPTLMIIPSRDDDGAQYKCRAELDLGPEGPQPHPTVTSKPLTITVHYKPEIVCSSQYSAVEEKSTLDRIACEFHGNPPPNVVWYQEGRQVNASAPLARTDLGQYVITITNDIGSTNSTVHITVEYAPTFNCIDQYEVKENENHNLPVTCTVDANPSSKITWFKGQQEVDIPQCLTRENRGEYTLVTNNTHGEASHKLFIDVLYAPEFLLGNDTVVVSKGSNVSLNCSAEGNPPPEMKWNYTAALNVKLSTEGRQRTVRITAATSTNAGIYICTATNRVGTATRTTTVTMKDDYTNIIIVITCIIVILVGLLIFLKVSRVRNRQGNYNFIPINTTDDNQPNNVPMMSLSTTGVGN